MRSRVVIDTNVLVYATFVDNEYHYEAYRMLQRRDVAIPYIVLYEYLWVLARPTGDVDIVMTKLDELSDFPPIHEDLKVMRRGISMLKEDGAPLSMLNDYIILSVSMSEGALATYDKTLRRLAAKRQVAVMP
jgi:predicted nucleic acid-binding protein